MNISIIIRLSWNQFRCLVQYSVHKRIAVSSEQGQDKDKQMLVVNKFCPVAAEVLLKYKMSVHTIASGFHKS